MLYLLLLLVLMRTEEAKTLPDRRERMDLINDIEVIIISDISPFVSVSVCLSVCLRVSISISPTRHQ